MATTNRTLAAELGSRVFSELVGENAPKMCAPIIRRRMREGLQRSLFGTSVRIGENWYWVLEIDHPKDRPSSMYLLGERLNGTAEEMETDWYFRWDMIEEVYR